MSDRAAMLRETVQAFTDLRAMFDRLTEEQASRVWLGVLGVRDIVIHKHGPATLRGLAMRLRKRPRAFAKHVASWRLAPSGD
jgi:hypothetical protein